MSDCQDWIEKVSEDGSRMNDWEELARRGFSMRFEDIVYAEVKVRLLEIRCQDTASDL
jgi:hypothetical protein